VLTRRYWLKTCLLLRTGDSITLTSITSEPNSTFLQHASTAANHALKDTMVVVLCDRGGYWSCLMLVLGSEEMQDVCTGG
jgi:hypothetical protein